MEVIKRGIISLVSGLGISIILHWLFLPTGPDALGALATFPIATIISAVLIYIYLQNENKTPQKNAQKSLVLKVAGWILAGIVIISAIGFGILFYIAEFTDIPNM